MIGKDLTLSHKTTCKQCKKELKAKYNARLEYQYDAESECKCIYKTEDEAWAVIKQLGDEIK